MQLKCSLNLSPILGLRILGYHLHHTCENALMANFDLGWVYKSIPLYIDFALLIKYQYILEFGKSLLNNLGRCVGKQEILVPKILVL